MVCGNAADTEKSRGESRHISKTTRKNVVEGTGRKNRRKTTRNRMKNHVRVKLDKMSGDHAEKKRVVEKPVLLSENSHLRVVELASTGNLSILDEYLRNNEQICP